VDFTYWLEQSILSGVFGLELFFRLNLLFNEEPDLQGEGGFGGSPKDDGVPGRELL